VGVRNADFVQARRALGILSASVLFLLAACQTVATPSAGGTSAATSAPAPATAKPAAAASPNAGASPAASVAPAAPSPIVSPVAAGAAAAGGTSAPLKLGVLLSTSGPFVFEGGSGIDSIKLYLSQHNNQLGGRPVDVVYEDTAGQPDQTLTKAKKLVEQDKVDLLVGPVGSNEALAIRDYVDQQQVPMVVGWAVAKDLTQDQASPYIFRTTGSLQDSAGGGWLAAKKLGYKNVIVVSADYVAGHDAADAFKKYFEAAGGKVVSEIYPPLGVTDVAPYITSIQSQIDQVDAVVLPQIVGDTAIQFVKQYDQYGLKAQKPLFTGVGTVDDGTTLPPEGDSAVGIRSYAEWAPTLDLPANKQFMDAFRAMYGKDPGSQNVAGYNVIQFIDKGLAAAHGNTTDKQALIQAFGQVQFDAPGGPLKVDEKHQAVVTLYLRTVEQQNGGLVNTVNDKVDNVSQNWTAPN
jgi:branched-chain amino acid transport system substrate-binding protein